MNDFNQSSVSRLHVEELTPQPNRARSKPVEMATNEPPADTPQAFITALAVVKAGAYALSARALLLLALIGAFVLARQAMEAQTFFSLAILALYCAFTILPVAYLETRRGRTP